MKVVCGACQAKYQIPDERVAGRKLKIRCRKCGEAIVVRGDQIAPDEEATQHIQTNGHHVNGVGVGSEWHLSVDGDQHGPYATEQMATMLRTGQVAWEAYAWREGYTDWKVVAESDTLVRAVANMPAPTPEAELAPPPEAFEEDGPTRIAGSVPPGALAPVARTTFSARAAQRVNHAALETPAPVAVAAVEQPVDYGYATAPVAAPSPFSYGGSPYVSADQALTGERHEDSVLFSTKNLQSATSASQASPARGGFAGGEGSGLIDIRALAALARTSQTHSTNGAANGASASESGQFGRRGRDEVMTLANQTGAFSNLDSLRPFETPASRQSSNAVPIAIVVGSAIVAAAVVVAVLITRDTPAVPVTAVSQPIAPEPAAAPAEPEPAAAEPEAAQPTAAAEDAVKEPEPEAEPSARERAAAKSSAKSEKRSSGSSKRAQAQASKSEPKSAKSEGAIAAKAAAAPAEAKPASIDDILLADPKPEKGAKAEKAAPEPEPEAAPAPEPVAKPATPSRGRSIDELLEGAVVEGEKKGEKSAPSAASAALADSPTRDQVKTAMQAIEPAVKACAEGQTVENPMATVAITVAGSSGKVSSVRVTGIAGAIGSCVARAVRNATFPKFAKESFSVNFPFRLQ